jgi:hypothetical protein
METVFLPNMSTPLQGILAAEADIAEGQRTPSRNSKAKNLQIVNNRIYNQGNFSKEACINVIPPLT